jgi:molybdopterin synthase catalytic subunit
MSSLHKGSSIISISGNEAYDIAIQQGFALLDKPINDRRLKLALLNDQSGALATFEGWVRNHNNARPVTKLTYYGYEKLAINQGEKLITQAKQQFDIINAVAIHRIGDLAIGDMAVWIGVTAHHRFGH